ncbi:prepilin peptidase [Oceanobacillus indicireducens]|uniref:Type 4 prepilin-like proteins leader peptide-processing enzyme n=1 Tax=Oceanobacillus indicireducens TaxID=1004261 RepID=A0A917XRI1_9BACI|nr:A24 family peptidase [Oceanobacillus indicireducens]GGN48849.1 type 4 prepilin-like proteins leader peptide-processing enzyme [Oceanobacillus indicireducens]
MELFLSIIFFLFGATFGSFFNVVGIRSPKSETFVNDRSYCPKCKKTLTWYELIPIISYLVQRGKCRNCKEKISLIYPVVETLTGALFVLSYLMIGLNVELITALLLVSMLMIIFVSDIHYMIIQNKILLFFLPLFIILRFIAPLEPWWSPIAGAVVATVLLALIILVTRGGMGAGDMKLFGVLGIVLGLHNVLLAFFLACLIGAIVGSLLIALKIVKRKQPIPFGPYIVLGALIAYFYGERIIRLYMGLYT